MNDNNTNENIIIIGVVLFAISLRLEPVLDQVLSEIKSVNWLRIIVIITLVLVLGYLIFILLKVRLQKKKEKIRKLNDLIKLENNLKKLLQKNVTNYSSFTTEEIITELNEFLKSIPEEILIKYQPQIKNFNKKAKAHLTKLRKQEEQGIAIEKQQKIKFEEQVRDLFSFKKRKNSIEALPLDKKYNENIIHEAEHRLREYRNKQKSIQHTKERAIKYYSNNDLNTQPNITSEEEPIYKEIRKQIKQGKIKIKKPIVKQFKKLTFPKPFYRAKDLSEKQRKEALSQGFIHIRGIELDGNFCGGGFYIKKETEKESNYHFYMKHLFAEIHPKMLIEYGLDGKRSDVAFINEGLRIGIEIETGTNNSEQLTAKIPWLDRNFQQWIFVCSRKNLEKYDKLVDNKKSYCLTPKKAKEKIIELIKTNS